MKKILKPLILSALLLVMCVLEPMAALVTNAAGRYEPAGFQFSGRVFLIGDSTVANYSEKQSKELGDRYGWGMKLTNYFDNITVRNLAIGGISSRTFLQQENYKTLESELGEGDYLFIQFGHNDQLTDKPERHTTALIDRFADGKDIIGKYSYDYFLKQYSATNGKTADGQYSYEYFLSLYINLAKEKKAVPVLVTPMTQLSHEKGNEGAPDCSGHKPYQQAMMKLGRDSNVAVIDLTTKTVDIYNEVRANGKATDTYKFHSYTNASKNEVDIYHLSSEGADMIASLIAEETEKQGLSLSRYRNGASYKINATAASNTADTTNAENTNNTANTNKNGYESSDFVFSGNIHIVGDSTAMAFDEGVSEAYDRYGWGMKLASQFNGVTVNNLACGGASSRNFINTLGYATLMGSSDNALKGGDYLFIQFGHGDLITGRDTVAGLGLEGLDSEGKNAKGQYSFEYYLTTYYINPAIKRGAVPVLVTPITYRKADGSLSYSALESYKNAMIALGKEYNIPVIDMTSKSVTLCNNAGAAAANYYAYANDSKTTRDTENLSGAGAEKIASLIAQETKALGLTLGTKVR